MFIDTPPITLSCTRTGAHAFPNEHLFDIPTLHDSSGNPAVQAGDFCVVGVLTNQNNNVVPTRIVPAGFTLIATSVGTQQNGNTAQGNMYAKILTAADIGAVKATTNPTDNGRVMCATFRMSKPVQSFTSKVVVDSGPSGGAPGALQTGASSAADDLIPGTSLFVGMGLAQSGHTDTFVQAVGSGAYNLVDVNDNVGNIVSATRIGYGMWPYGLPLFSLGVLLFIQMPDASTINSNYSALAWFVLN